MDCKIKFKDISGYMDNACSVKQKQNIELHMKECGHCRQILYNAQLLKNSLSSLTQVKESENFDFAFNQKLKQAQAKEKIAFSLNDILKNTLSGIKEAFTIKTPALVKIMALLLITVSVLFGSYNYYTYLNLPYVESLAGGVNIYNAQTQKWVKAKPDIRLRQNDIIKTAANGTADIISKNKYTARIKESSNIAIAKLDVRSNNHFMQFSIASGKLMVNTASAFKGSQMLLKTPACQTKVVGTAFIINVDEKSGGDTWLGVLEGKVKMTAKGEDVYINAGQKSQSRLGNAPDMPTILSDNEWKQVQELYQLGEKPQVVILVSVQPNRIEELLKPAPLYILDTAPRTIPKDLEAIIHIINKAIEDNDIQTHRFSIENLERLIKVHPNPKYNAQFMMFVGSYYYYIGDYTKAIDTFERVVKQYPGYSLSSLAQCAIGYIYKKDLRNEEKAMASFEALLRDYPDSIDAQIAKEYFKNLME